MYIAEESEIFVSATDVFQSHEPAVLEIHLIVTLNFFTSHDETYLQTHGTAMGSCMASTYANIFTGAIEKRLLCSFPYKPG
ncbi:hypothetical protein RRG08_034116 [Elysia crispata]|uniref:Uncharacterized protein n=1 Tax=Elysia crispata TaxID=231223 RepID=A0AAE0ZKC2_9GAST|nr:hypothetical protein RRG08_034116 [Elysia crispata]